MGLSFLFPLFTMSISSVYVSISSVYDVYFLCLRCLFPVFTVSISSVYDSILRVLIPDSHIFEPTFLYGVQAWYAWLMYGRAVYGVECLRVM